MTGGLPTPVSMIIASNCFSSICRIWRSFAFSTCRLPQSSESSAVLRFRSQSPPFVLLEYTHPALAFIAHWKALSWFRLKLSIEDNAESANCCSAVSPSFMTPPNKRGRDYGCRLKHRCKRAHLELRGMSHGQYPTGHLQDLPKEQSGFAT